MDNNMKYVPLVRDDDAHLDSGQQQQSPQQSPQESPEASNRSSNNSSNSSTPEEPPKLRILHFNDCYNVESRETEPKGGAPRFKHAIHQYLNDHTLVLFSGDILGPSIMSSITKGMHMVPVLNQCRVDCAVFGNHDFDFGVDNLTIFTSRCTFPWLISNVIDTETNRPLGDGKVYHIIVKNNVKIGLIGLVEEEWLATLSTISRDDVYFMDYVTEANKLCRFLRDTEHCDYIIALTHMRFPNDSRLAENCNELDLILGGHDHDYLHKQINGIDVIKSGTDFREFSSIDIAFKQQVAMDTSSADVDVKRIKLTVNQLNVTKVDVNSSDFIEDETLKQKLTEYVFATESKLDVVLGQFACDLDGRFSHIRTEETNLGNFVCDIMLAATHTDLAILNSGTLRSDRIHKKGDFKLRDLFQILPMLDPMIVLNVNGYRIWKALENGVSQYPKFEGRFPQVSGIQFAFDPSRKPGDRIDPRHIKIGDEYLDMNQNYKLITKGYLHQGKDGYEALKGADILVPEEDCPELCITIQNHFESIAKMLKQRSKSHHRQSLVCLSQRHSIVREQLSHQQAHQLEETDELPENNQQKQNVPPEAPKSQQQNQVEQQPPKQANDQLQKSETSPKPMVFNVINGNEQMKKGIPSNKCANLKKNCNCLEQRHRKMSIDQIEIEQCRLEPKVDGRIVVIKNKEMVEELERKRREFFEQLERSKNLNVAIDVINWTVDANMQQQTTTIE